MGQDMPSVSEKNQKWTLAKYVEEIKKNKLKLALLVLMTLLFISANTLWGGTTMSDVFGTSNIYTTLVAASQDKAMVGIVVLFLAVLGIITMIKGMILTGISLWAIALAFSKLEPIVDALTSGTLPL